MELQSMAIAVICGGVCGGIASRIVTPWVARKWLRMKVRTETGPVTPSLLLPTGGILSWMKQYYPITATEAAKLGELAAAEHSLHKWKGLLRENLFQHQVAEVVELNSDPDAEGDSPSDPPLTRNIADKSCPQEMFAVNGSTCALCQYAADKQDEAAGQNVGLCDYCPLFRVRGGIQCDESIPSVESTSPFSAYHQHGDPLPMIHELERTVAYVKSKSQPTAPTPDVEPGPNLIDNPGFEQEGWDYPGADKF